jgi:hypothetical protein
MNSKWIKAFSRSTTIGRDRRLLLLIPWCVILLGGAGPAKGGMDTGDPGTPFIGRVVNLAGYLMGIHPGQWPDKPDKNARLKQCSDLLRSAMDTNQIEMDCRKLTNQPELVLAIRNYAQQTLSNLDEAASLLTNAHLKTFTAGFGEGAEIVNPKNKNEWYSFVFYHNGPVLQFRKASVDGNHTGMQMNFHQNGRLAGELGGHLAFRANGQLDHCFINGKYILIPIIPGRYVAEDGEAQRKIYMEFSQTENPALRDQDARRLSNLWHDGSLDDGIKDRLAHDHYHLVLQQLPSSDGIPCWEVHCSQTFPFPDVSTDFTPTQYVNEQVTWAPGTSQSSCSMAVIGGPITSQTGGALKNGDVVQYKIDLTQIDRDRGRQWQISLWSNRITLQKLKD